MAQSVRIMAKKKVKPKKKAQCKKNCSREKVCGEPTPVKSVRPVNETYPKIFLRQDSLWTKIKRFFGYTQ